MTAKKNNNPLYGLKMDLLLTEISAHYGWERLSEALAIERFQYHTGMKSTIKFLRNQQWAKEKVENFYLYQYKNFPCPDDKQLAIAPRDRFIAAEQTAGEPVQITAKVISEIDRVSRLRTYQDSSVKKGSARRTEEPPYDPDNPWNQ